MPATKNVAYIESMLRQKERENLRLQNEIADLKAQLRKQHTAACNYRVGPIGSAGCICKVVQHMEPIVAPAPSLSQAVYTVSEVAARLKVAERTVRRWARSGQLKSYQVPGTQDYRMTRKHLVEFLTEHSMDAKEFLDGP